VPNVALVAALLIGCPFLSTVTAFDVKLFLESIIVTSSPIDGEAGKLTVIIFVEVLAKI